MGEQFRQAIDEELACENVPSVAGLIDRAVHDGHRLRRLRTVRTAAGGGFAAAVLAGVVVLVAGVPAHGPHAGGSGAVGGGTARRVVSLQANNGKVIRLDAASQQRVDAFVQCMREHGVDLGADFGRPTPDTLPTVPLPTVPLPSVPLNTGPTPSNEQFDQAVKDCEQQVPGVLTSTGPTR